MVGKDVGSAAGWTRPKAELCRSAETEAPAGAASAAGATLTISPKAAAALR